MNVLDDPKKAKMLGVLGALAEKIASGGASKKDIAQARRLEAEIPWPHLRIEALAAQCALLSKAEPGFKRFKKLSTKLTKKARRP